MCIVLLNLAHPDFSFICGANRDEVLARPAAASQWHNFPAPSAFSNESSPSPSLALQKATIANGQAREASNGSGIGQSHQGPSASQPILSGIDAHPSGGGTWIGITADGRFGALTNFTEYERPLLPQGRGLKDFRSRGTLVKDWLKPSTESSSLRDDLDTYLQGIDSHSDEWPGFNVLAGYLLDGDGRCAPRIGYVTNREEAQNGVRYLDQQNEEKSTAACKIPIDSAESSTRSSLGLSNSTLRTPWEKVKSGQEALDEALLRYDEHKAASGRDMAEDQLAQDIFDILATSNSTVTKREDLRNTVLVTPIMMPSGQWYATRVATVILVRRPDVRPGSNDMESIGDPVARWFERDIYVLDSQGQKPVRCGNEHQRLYQFILSRPSCK